MSGLPASMLDGLYQLIREQPLHYSFTYILVDTVSATQAWSQFSIWFSMKSNWLPTQPQDSFHCHFSKLQPAESCLGTRLTMKIVLLSHYDTSQNTNLILVMVGGKEFYKLDIFCQVLVIESNLHQQQEVSLFRPSAPMSWNDWLKNAN